MKANVEYMAQLRVRIGCSEEVIEIEDGGDVRALLNAVVEKHGDAAREVLLSAGEPAPTLLCFAGSDQVEFDTPLTDGQSLTLMTPISGG
jgi:molybdopterin converting factor small subunit